MNTEEAISSYVAYEEIREGAVDGADFGDLLGYDHFSKQKFEEEYANLLQKDEEMKCKGAQNRKRKPEESVKFLPLLNALRKLESISPFAIGGQSKLYFSDFHLHMRSVAGKRFNDFVNVSCVKSLNVESVLEYCQPSPYGDLLGNKNKIDPAVRLAVECKADRFKIVDEKPINDIYREKVDFMAEISNVVSSNLLKLNSSHKIDILLVPNKLNIYSENGHFKPHTDTPTHDPALFIGSVVVCLPSAHTGGNLIVRHAGKEVNFDFAAQSNNPDIVQFAAFYGDCEHEVLPVTSGHRVTITYSILKTRKGPSRINKEIDNFGKLEHKMVTLSADGDLRRSSRLTAILLAVHAELDTALERSPFVGVFLSHVYTHSGLSAANLKGADKLLYDLLTDTMHLPVSLTPVVTRTVYKIHDGDGGEYQRKDDIKPDCAVRLLMGFEDNRLPVHKNVSPEIVKDIAFLSGWGVKGLEVRNEFKQGKYAGNEVDPTRVDKIYIQGAMIIGPLPGSDSTTGCVGTKLIF